jgi:hypothetical protein
MEIAAGRFPAEQKQFFFFRNSQSCFKMIHNNTDTDSSIGNGETEISTVENGLLYDSPDRTAHPTPHEICSSTENSNGCVIEDLSKPIDQSTEIFVVDETRGERPTMHVRRDLFFCFIKDSQFNCNFRSLTQTT